METYKLAIPISFLHHIVAFLNNESGLDCGEEVANKNKKETKTGNKNRKQKPEISPHLPLPTF